MRKKNKVCKICLLDKKVSEFDKYQQTCKECFHLLRCYICKDVFEKKECRAKNRCNKCDNALHEFNKKKKPTETYKKKVKRNNDTRNAKLRLLSKPKMTKEEAKSLERIRCSVHKIFKRWYIQKKGKSFNYLPYTREEFLLVYPVIPDTHDIDHKIPMSWFIMGAPIAVVYHLDNLQLLPRIENQAKNNNWAHPVSQSYYNLALPHIKPEYVNNMLIEK